MKKAPILSICIPTYGRPMYTLETLNSIVPQMNDKTELVVVDDNSQDGTYEVVKLFKQAHPELKIAIEQNKSNLGFDRNVLKVMSKARGEYAWLFGNDDKLLSGSVNKVLKIISLNKNSSLIHVNYSRYDDLLKKITAKKMVGSIAKDIYFDSAEDFYFRKINKSYFKYLGTNTITMSTDIIQKGAWDYAVKRVKKYLGHNFIHSFVIATAIHKLQKIVYVANPLVEYRANNHRIWPNDIWKDYNNILLGYLIDIGYDAKKIQSMKKTQKSYEQREAAMKNPMLTFAFKYGRPVIATLRLVRDKIQ